MDVQQLEELAVLLIGKYGWILLSALVVLAFKDSVASMWAGAKQFWFGDFRPDDIIYISGRKAIIARMSISRTVFYMYDRRTKMVVPNVNLKDLVLEKLLEEMEAENYLPKGSEKKQPK